tara:strand:+ start:1534 stop:1719 length:186 start_codon:yes stop_codon:yes gene_type:complete
MKTVKLTDQELTVIMNCLDDLAEHYDKDFITIRDGGHVDGMDYKRHKHIKAIHTAYKKLTN